ncbi:MAG: penicillin-binding protein [Eubacterium sp.]|nr:penicillin-binding protein [Eubacterium sp.]
MNKIFRSSTAVIAVLALVLSLLCDNSTVIAESKTLHSGKVEVFKSKLDKSVTELQKRYGVPGAAVGIIQNGKVEYILNYGLEDSKENKPLSDNTVFQVASMSKSLTAWGIMKLVEDGKISLDDPAEKYLISWHIPDSKFNKDEVTIKRLLSHTAGLSVHGYLGIEPGKRIPTIEESLSGKVFLQESLEIVMQPGSAVSYSGGGYTLLQLIIEEITGMSFDQYMEKEILRPLGMENSTFSNAVKNSNLSKAYGYFGQELPNFNFTEEAAAGLKTTMPDFLKFVLAGMDGIPGEIRGRNVLRSQSIDLMHTPVKSDSGLGVFEKKLSDESILLNHGGDNRGWHSFYGFIPEKKDGIVIFTNSDNGIDLRQDIYNFWVEYETGTLPAQYQAMEKSRHIYLAVAFALGILLAVYLLFFLIKLKQGRRVFISRLQLQGGLKNIAGLIFIWLLVLFITGFFPNSRRNNITR